MDSPVLPLRAAACARRKLQDGVGRSTPADIGSVLVENKEGIPALLVAGRWSSTHLETCEPAYRDIERRPQIIGRRVAGLRKNHRRHHESGQRADPKG